MQLDVLAQNNMQKDNAALKRYKNDVFAKIDSLIDIPYGEAINLIRDEKRITFRYSHKHKSDMILNIKIS